MRVLVTGSAGFVGSHLVDELRHDGHTVIGVDVEETPAPLALRADLKTLAPARVPRFDVCLHLASDVGGFLHNAQNTTLEANEMALFRAARRLCERDGARLVYVSSIAVFETSGAFGHGPLERLDQRTPYARAKARTEALVAASCDDFVIVRPTNIFGASQRRSGQRIGESHVIPDLLHKIAHADRLEVLGDGQQVRNFIHVDDVVRFLARVVARPAARGWFNLRSNIELRIAELATLLLRMTGQAREIVYRPDYLRYEPQRIEAFDLTAPRALGWAPRVGDLIAGLTADGARDLAVGA